LRTCAAAKAEGREREIERKREREMGRERERGREREIEREIMHIFALTLRPSFAI
jgi:hypothetical protein